MMSQRLVELVRLSVCHFCAIKHAIIASIDARNYLCCRLIAMRYRYLARFSSCNLDASQDLLQQHTKSQLSPKDPQKTLLTHNHSPDRQSQPPDSAQHLLFALQTAASFPEAPAHLLTCLTPPARTPNPPAATSGWDPTGELPRRHAMNG